ncbi:hypothetical protein HHL22_21635 [Hymenobacter sp. RP-2-7]|uniref:Lipoprotein n=1 Tax=Hymenobacter polaris TaxID=2682546 RepID=A0A7Y0FPA3_9BACT|nr:hypothetical protein [Hymenobacter polaris]NML67813.1 hypothetical protein [Hymenobacter polaris]
MKYFPALLRLGYLLPALLGATACSVYVPMQNAAPEIRHRGEVEVAGSWSFTNRLEAAAAYSPLPHLLVRAAFSTKGSRPGPGDSTAYAHVNQTELALGTYWPLGPSWLLGGLLATGQAQPDALFRGDGGSLHGFVLVNHDPLHRFEGSYRKHSAELYAVWQPGPRVGFGLSGRLVQTRLTSVTDLGAPVQAAPSWRAEPMFFVRFWPRVTQPGLLQVQLALGASRTLGYDPLTAGDTNDPARQFKLGQAYASVGLALYPHVWWQHRDE